MLAEGIKQSPKDGPISKDMLPRNLGININNTVPKKAALIREAVRFERKKYGQDEKKARSFLKPRFELFTTDN